MVPARWLVIGAGYVGEALVRALLARGEGVLATRRTREGAEQSAARTGAEVVVFDAAGDRPLRFAGPGPYRVVYTAAPSDTEGRAERRFVESLAGRGCVRAVYLSSTGVYPAAHGGLVDEETPTVPASPRGAARLAAERAFARTARGLGIEVAVLRVAGIYGPSRGVYARLLQGSFRLIGSGDTMVSRIHVDDLVTAIIRAATIEQLPFEIYNVADDEPTTGAVYARACADAAGIAEVPQVALEAVSEDVRAMMTADRRVSNRRLREALGVELAYPSWREGLEALSRG